VAAIVAGKVDRGSTVAAANIQHAKTLPNIAQASAMVEEIDLGLTGQFVPAQEETVVYVVTPESAVDPCKPVVVFANCIRSHHGSEGCHAYDAFF